MSAPNPARSKVVSIDDAAKTVAGMRAEGKTVVLAHGVFDLIHLGHARHLTEARNHGDFLVVSITDDKFVNKGPERPIFTSELRAEMLASFSLVDMVVISKAASAVPVLNSIKPTVYVKGKEYAVAEDDVTGKIVDEKNAVEAGGGRIEYTDDIVFSSSSLINKHLDVYRPELRSYLDEARSRFSLQDLSARLEALENMKVLLVGDTIIDEYQYVMPMGKSPKENMIATKFENREVFAGGVIAAANHVASFCGSVEVLTCLGSEDNYEDLVREVLDPAIKLKPIYRDGSVTTRKSRFVDPSYLRKLFEVYFFDDSPMPEATQRLVDDEIARRAGDFDIVIVTDFGHGMVAPSTIQTLINHAPFLAVNAQSNSANHGYNLITKYAKADFICIDAPEARLAASDRFGDISDVITENIAPRTSCGKMIVTHGNRGCVYYDSAVGANQMPAFTRTVVDTIGAGDAFLSIAAPLVASGAPLEQSAFIGNAVGAIKVGIVGHRSRIEKPQLLKYLTTLMK